MEDDTEREVTGYESNDGPELSWYDEMMLSIAYDQGLWELFPDVEAWLISRMSYQEYLATPYWKRIRDQVLARDLLKCRDCGDDASEVHHIRYPRIRGDENLDDLVSVCRSCHVRRHKADAERGAYELAETNPDFAARLGYAP